MRIKSEFILLFASIISLCMLLSCSCKGTWSAAKITYHNGFESSGYICCKANSFFAYFSFKAQTDGSKLKMYPDEVHRVASEKCSLISMKFEKKDYGVDSFSFGKVLAGDEIVLVDTRYLVNTCNCSGKDSYLNDYFLIYKSAKIKIKTNNSGTIFNMKTLYDFVYDNTGYELSQNVKDIKSLRIFLENINNSNF